MKRLARTDRSIITTWRRTLDWPLLAACGVLLAIGLLLSLSAGLPAAERLGYGSYYYVYRHMVFALGASLVLMTVSMFDMNWARRLALLVCLGAFALMAWVLIFGHEAKGAQRWIRLAGFSLQPSEMLKPALIVLVAWLLSQKEHYPKLPWDVMAVGFFAFALLLLVLQPDIGQSALLSLAVLATFFVSGLSWRLASGFAGGGVALGGFLYLALPHVRYRVHSFIAPSDYDTYQIDRAREAIERGGLLGAGPGEGRVKSVLPDAHNDFIYAVLSEEFGFIAALGLLALYAFIVIRGCLLAARIEDNFARAAATGLFALFGLQSGINIAVNVSLIPPKGMTLPFVSFGGSSLIGTALTLGLALAFVRYRRAHVPWRRLYVY